MSSILIMELSLILYLMKIASSIFYCAGFDFLLDIVDHELFAASMKTTFLAAKSFEPSLPT